MGLLADAKVSLLDPEFAKKDTLPLCFLSLSIGAICVALAVGIGESALNAVVGLGGFLLGLHGVKFGFLDKRQIEKSLNKLPEISVPHVYTRRRDDKVD
jgi:hypothetical protein